MKKFKHSRGLLQTIHNLAKRWTFKRVGVTGPSFEMLRRSRYGSNGQVRRQKS